jgi:signal transduction histidine kinase
VLTRVRTGFALLAVLLLVPLGVLIARSLETLERERGLQHASVANRVFDEVERELAGFLREEQARPADQYRQSLQPSQPFVLGYFQIDRNGRLETPYAQPGRELELRAAAQRFAPPPRDAAPARRQAEFSDKLGKRAKTESTREAEAQPPTGTARNVQSVDLITGRETAPSAAQKRLLAPKESKSGLSSSSAALEQLGEIAKSKARAEIEPERPTEDEADLQAAPSPAAEPNRGALDDAVANVPVQRAGNTRTQGGGPLGSLAGRANIAPSRLSGERVDAARMLLYRTALLDDGVPYRQGLWVDLDGLGEWLRGRVLGSSELRDSLELALLAVDAGPGPALPDGRFVYEYRFAEPFDALQARLAMTPLGDGGAARYIGWMALLMVAASTLGLYALYRTAAVAIHFGERRSNFAAAVSHELKTPLTAIRMYAEMLRDGMAGDEAKRQEYYATITSESERLTRLINNVLEWSKLESQQRELAPVAASIAAPLREVLRVLEPHARAQGFELVLDLPADLPPARHDPDALQQILFNLIDNALKYARAAEPRRIEVRCARSDDGVAVRVRDHGPGVPPGDLPLIFEAFYRAGDELTRRTKGTGIGLALVRGLAEAMGGSVQARNLERGLEVELHLRGAAA